MQIGSCGNCPTKDQIIADLRQQVADRDKTLLAMYDARAYALRHPAEKPAAPAGPPLPPPRSPGRLSADVLLKENPLASIEALFDEQEAVERRIQGNG